MTTKSMLRLLKLDDKAFENICKAVQKEEQNTNGEIVLALTAESAPYAFWELFFSVIIAAVVFAAMLPFAFEFQKIAQHLFWSVPVWFVPFVFGCIVFAVIAIAFFITNIPLIDRCVIPQIVQKQSSYERALRCFTECGVYKTKDSSGILVFASFLERKVFILADTGIAEKVEQPVWDSIALDLAKNLKAGDGEKAFVQAVEKCGSILKENFPAKKENPDELGDGLLIL